MHNTVLDYFREHLESGKFICEIETAEKTFFKDVFANALKRGMPFRHSNQKIISVILPNSTCYIEYLLATIATNNIFNPLPYFTSAPELEKIFHYLAPAFIVTDRRDIADQFHSSYSVIDTSVWQLPKKPIEIKPVDPHLPAALYYSSGTTSDPKGVLYSHRNMVSLILSIVRGFRFTANDNQLAFLPFGHTASINYNILPALVAGSNLFISKGFEHLRDQFFEVLARHRITYTEIVPTILTMLLKLNFDVSKLDLNSLRFIGCGSSFLPLESQKEFIKTYGIKVANLYGLSETGPSHIDDPLKKGWKPGSIGIPLDVNDCRIAPDGEILLKGDNVFIGYYKNPRAYKKVVQNGWFHTGDLGTEKGGRFYFLDRKKDLIIKGGINVVPAEIEEVLYKHANVLECVVTGKRNEIFGEDVVAVVVPKTKVDSEAFVRDLKQICKRELSGYKIPSEILIWEELPKTHSHKLLRRKVRDVINEVKPFKRKS